eukprot:COSAG02_NODE_9386_length_2234_cov_1.903513_2_plen_143_part_00
MQPICAASPTRRQAVTVLHKDLAAVRNPLKSYLLIEFTSLRPPLVRLQHYTGYAVCSRCRRQGCTLSRGDGSTLKGPVITYLGQDIEFWVSCGLFAREARRYRITRSHRRRTPPVLPLVLPLPHLPRYRRLAVGRPGLPQHC